jgi:hypothetical protein
LDSSFNNPDGPGPGPAPETPAAGGDNAALSPAVERFQSCRWRKAPEDGIAAHCTHRDVLPMTGTAGFVPESWCPDCAFYKAKRIPKKPHPQEDWRRW